MVIMMMRVMVRRSIFSIGLSVAFWGCGCIKKPQLCAGAVVLRFSIKTYHYPTCGFLTTVKTCWRIVSLLG